MVATKLTVNMPWACFNDGDMQTCQNRALLLVPVKTGSLPSSAYVNRCVGADTHGHKDRRWDNTEKRYK
jgi:hypothetical protein